MCMVRVGVVGGSVHQIISLICSYMYHSSLLTFMHMFHVPAFPMSHFHG